MENNRNPLKFTREVEDILINYPWPGNVRELENLMERFSILCDGDIVTPEDLPPKILDSTLVDVSKKRNLNSSTTAPVNGFVLPTIDIMREMGFTLKDFLEYIENSLLKEALEKSGGVKNKAAKLLGIKRTTLIEKLKKKGMG